MGTEVLRLLIAEGADVNVKCDDRYWLIHHAAMHNPNPRIVKYLLEKGADVKARAESGRTPLHSAAFSNRNVDILKHLLANGAEANARDNDGVTPFFHVLHNDARWCMRCHGRGLDLFMNPDLDQPDVNCQRCLERGP